jgi:hypothetical protein
MIIYRIDILGILFSDKKQLHDKQDTCLLAVWHEVSVISVLVNVERVPRGTGLLTVRALEALGLQMFGLWTTVEMK